jgi:hypothetical protein
MQKREGPIGKEAGEEGKFCVMICGCALTISNELEAAWWSACVSFVPQDFSGRVKVNQI